MFIESDVTDVFLLSHPHRCALRHLAMEPKDRTTGFWETEGRARMSSLWEGPEFCPVTLTVGVTWSKSRPSLAQTNQKMRCLPAESSWAGELAAIPTSHLCSPVPGGQCTWSPWPTTFPY